MRILHVAPLVTPDGAYGGPITVAFNQLGELARRGHDVKLIAGTSGYRHPPTRVGDVPVQLFPVQQVVPRAGFAGMTSRQLLRHVSAVAQDSDVVHVHVARDLVSMPAAWIAARAGMPLILQPHGMVDRSPRRSAHAFDRLLTRSVFRSATGILTLTRHEEHELSALGLPERSRTRIPNGIDVTHLDHWPAEADGDENPEVLFLARLAKRKRPLVFVSMAERLAEQFPTARFTLIGPDEGEGSRVRDALRRSKHSTRIRWEGAIEPASVRDRIGKCSIYVLPAVDEVFPMTVLEAMSVGRPVVITRSNGLAQALTDANAGIVSDPAEDELATAVGSLLADLERRRVLGRAGRKFVRENWSVSVVGDVLERVYSEAIPGQVFR